MRRVVLERIEDELDLKAWKEAKDEFNAGSETPSVEDSARKCL